ncbi:unnamed protein product [Ectocarpus sp. CCAP 1310/34]|nr:unnamed protein product [Ectocarpus sp. CCAP 1310/34]
MLRGRRLGITLLNTVGNAFCRLLNDRIVGVLEKEHSISEDQAGRIIQGRERAGKPTYCFFLDVKKAYDTSMEKRAVETTVHIRCTKKAVMLDGELSKFVDIEQGVTQGCALSPTLFQVFINDLLEVVEAVRKGVNVGDTETSVSRMLFADDVVGMSDTPEGLQLQIDAAKKFTDKWRLSANVQECAVMVCNENKEEPVEHRWKWGIEEIAVVDQYTYLGVEIAKDCSWNAHMSKVAEKGKARAGKLHPILANRHLDTRIKLKVLKSVIVPPLRYAGEVWEGNKKVVKELEAAQMKAAKIILGYSKRTSNASRQGRIGDPIPTVGERREEADLTVSHEDDKECTKSAVMIDGELSKFFGSEQGVPQGCTLSPTLLQVFINDLFEAVEAVRKKHKSTPPPPQSTRRRRRPTWRRPKSRRWASSPRREAHSVMVSMTVAQQMSPIRDADDDVAIRWTPASKVFSASTFLGFLTSG